MRSSQRRCLDRSRPYQQHSRARARGLAPPSRVRDASVECRPSRQQAVAAMLLLLQRLHSTRRAHKARSLVMPARLARSPHRSHPHNQKQRRLPESDSRLSAPRSKKSRTAFLDRTLFTSKSSSLLSRAESRSAKTTAKARRTTRRCRRSFNFCSSRMVRPALSQLPRASVAFVTRDEPELRRFFDSPAMARKRASVRRVGRNERIASMIDAENGTT
jgi:hypothetical protein